MESRNRSQCDQDPDLPDLPIDIPAENFYPAPRPKRVAAPVQHSSDDAITTTSHVRDTPEPVQPRPRRPTTRRSRVSTSRNEDVVVSLQPIQEGVATGVREEQAHVPFVLPPLRELASQTVPSAVMALTLLGAAAVGDVSVLRIPIWAFAVTIPTLMVLFLSNGVLRPLWKEASIINLIAVLVVFPTLVVRQSVSRIPFSDASNGTLLAPLSTTVLVVGMLIGVAVLCAVLCREDPEYAGVVFLPAAMLVPFFAGAGDITNLRTAMLMTVAMFVATAALTVVATILPSRFAVAIAPAAIMVEFLVLAAVRGADVFPLGAGVASKVLFFSIVTFTVALTILVPMLTFWLQQVTLIVRSGARTMVSASS